MQTTNSKLMIDPGLLVAGVWNTRIVANVAARFRLDEGCSRRPRKGGADSGTSACLQVDEISRKRVNPRIPRHRVRKRAMG